MQPTHRSLTLSRQQVRFLDQFAIEHLGISGLVLMENAGRGVVEQLIRRDLTGSVAIYCGAGNNAGDGFVMARQLAIRSIPSRCIMLYPAEKLTGDALANYKIAKQIEGIEWACLPEKLDMNELKPEALGETLNPIGNQPIEWIVDALLGTGTKGSLRPPLPQLLNFLNQAPLKRLAVDLPTGLDCDSGISDESTFQATLTCTFAALKPGLLTPAAQRFVGELECIDIGLPKSFLELAKQEFDLQADGNSNR